MILYIIVGLRCSEGYVEAIIYGTKTGKLVHSIGYTSSESVKVPNNIKTRGNTAERILEIATKHFAQTGFECTNLRDIANEVGIREPSIYRHFKNKEELYKQVLLNSLEPLAETILAIIQANPNPREVLEVPSRVLAFFCKKSTCCFLASAGSGNAW